MSIKIVCECGRELRVREELAGKKVKCPQCGGVFRMPQSQFAASPPKPDPPPRPKSGVKKSPAEVRPAPIADDAEDDGTPYQLESRPVSSTFYDPEPASAWSAPPSSNRPGAANGSRASRPEVRGGPESILEYSYVLLFFALVPLMVSLLVGQDQSDIKDRIARSIAKAAPEDQPRLRRLLADDKLSTEEVLAALPGGKLDGAHLPRDTSAHWVYATIAAVGFLLLLGLFFSVERADPVSLIGIGAFTGTVGIVFLLLVQFCSTFRVTRIRGFGIIVVIFLILTFIGWSYDSANDPNSSFLLSALGFTFGVGLCEEFTKAIPLLYSMKRDSKLGWRGACQWGLASGIGFGVSEGIMYSARYYNGLSDVDSYLVRFVSCVALHAMWSASVGIAIARNVENYEAVDDWATFGLFSLRVIAVPMVLHGFYDTLLKMDMGGWALVVAILSFGWLAWHIELARGTHPGAGRPRVAKRKFAY